MSAKSKRKSVISMPTSVYIIGLWAIVRAATPVFALIGQYNINKTFLPQIGEIDSNSSSFFSWLLASNQLGLVSIAISIAFLTVGIGLMVKQKWGRLGFLITSAVVFLWNIRAISWGRYSIPLYSLVALGLAYWYFRQPNILRFFEAKDYSPSLLNRKVFNASLDLVISLGILTVLLVLELVGLLQYGMI